MMYIHKTKQVKLTGKCPVDSYNYSKGLQVALYKRSMSKFPTRAHKNTELFFSFVETDIYFVRIS